jgi:predicted permease
MISQRWSIKVVFRNPMILATILGISVSVMQVTIPEFLRLPIHMLGQVSIPLLLFSLGVRMLAIDFKDWQIGVAGALICPISGLIAALLFLQVIDLPSEQVPVLLLFSALPPAVLNFLVAERFNQEPQKVASIVLIANFSSIIVIPAVLWVIL